ncbi:MAG: hypothetical protein ACYCUX_05370 [Metallibacterium sp.]
MMRTDSAMAAPTNQRAPLCCARHRIDRETLDEQDGGIGKVGYEINFNRVFFQYQPPRPLHEIDAELAGVEQRILELLREVTE